MSPLPPGTRVDGYVVESLLGAGGSGTVYRVRGPEGHRSALKLLPLEERAWRELALGTRLHHPNLVRVLGAGQWPESTPRFLWVRMELIEGPTLEVWAREPGRDTGEVVDRMLEVARGLAVAHEAGVVHRDVKEANILVRESDGQAVLVDFGVGHHERDATLTQGLFPPGTLHYRAPEAWDFGQRNLGVLGAHYRAGPGDDLYAQGVVLYRVLTGRFPFLAGEDGNVDVQAVLHRAPLPPHLVNPRVPREVSQVCLRLLEKTPQARYPGAVALCEALEALRARADAAWKVPLRGETRPAAVKQRTHGSRRRAVAAVGVGVALVLGGGWWLTQRGWPEREVSGRELATDSSPRMSPVEAPLRETRVSQEVASPELAPESAPAAAAPPRASTPATAASRAAPRKDNAPVKQQPKTSDLPSDAQPTNLETFVRNACLGLTGAALQACMSAQPQVIPVRPVPTPQECPAGAVETMGTLGLRRWDMTSVQWSDVRGRPVPVREDSTVEVAGHWETSTGQIALPSRTRLSGRLYVREGRVYGRFIEARTPTGDTYTVCLELMDTDDDVGLALKPGSEPGNILVGPVAQVRVVNRFE